MAVVKFVERYGAGAHRLLAEAIVAPRLLFCGSIDGQHKLENLDAKHVFGLHLQSPRMVVMEYIEGTHGEALMAKPKDVYTQVKAMVEKLHDSGYVFGNLRPPNVVFAASKPFLVDLIGLDNTEKPSTRWSLEKVSRRGKRPEKNREGG